ncbi:MAG: 5-oxoprolinase subunit B family protein, partial [Acidimicrobiales bacterium]
ALLDVVPGAETVLVLAATAGDLARVLANLSDPPASAADPATPATHPAGATHPSGADVVHVDVRYDGPDLEAVGELTGLGVAGVVAAHAGARFRGAFSGFAPGFCYLDGLPDSLRVPRLAQPRASVPPGSVAITDRYSAVYPRATPGGWRLLGRTEAVVWDSHREPPALLRPGTVVIFHPIR